MVDEARVWIRERKCKSGKSTYHLRWICPTAQAWKSRKVGSDRRRAEREAAGLEKELQAGTYTEIRKTTWPDFVAEHVARIPGKRHADEAGRILKEFGDSCSNPEPRRITFTMVESYVETMTAKGNTQATVNKKLRYLRTAFKKAMKRGYLGKNPMEDWGWTREDDPDIRVISAAEEASLLTAAEDLYGSRMKAFILAALGTGGRRNELLSLTWDRADLEAGEVLFIATKGKRDRRVPILGDLVDVFRKLQVQTLQEGGPFIGLEIGLHHHWAKITAQAGLSVRRTHGGGKGRKAEEVDCPTVTVHDLRRTYISRLILAGASLPTVQKLAGHREIGTTMRYYTKVSRDDLRAGVELLRKVSAG